MKEHKIGEIFEYNGEWYQCVEEEKSCINCAFRGTHRIDICVSEHKCLGHSSEDMPVIFKKLEKIEEPYIIGNKLIQRYKIYPTTYHINVYGWYYHNLDVKSWTIDIEIKQNKEDMEQEIEYFGDENAKCFNSESIGKNLKPFDLEAAKQGKPVCTRDGRKARIICFDRKDNTPIVALIERVDGIEILQCFYNDGKCFHDSTSDNDLMMLPEKKEGWVNVYKGIDGVTFSKHPYTSKDEAIKKSGILFGRIDTIKVSWEE